MKPSHRVLLVALLVPLLLVAVAVCAWLVESARTEVRNRAFLAIREGATEHEVVSSLGVPSRVRPCGENLWWGDDANYRGKNVGACVTEARYEYFLVAFGVGYSREGTVVSKYRYVSE